ncbi:MAG: 3-methyl-2-oxobutanoate dehydrogenase subunit VorB [Candidatus Eremiobacteraeota bacterium]|nr:3-methyl-2-oxobutanoate dehydrogenase subunit VorB [Candidatus Eremiobacteraeota bacterium]
MAKILMKGNEAIGEAAITAGCKHFFGYPITPQSELPAYLARKLPKIGGVFLQAESEVSAINMVYGAASAGIRVMTSSSSPGVSLKQEGISYIAGAELPCVICNVQRGGPGLGTIQPSQADYFQATKGGGHGDYNCIVLAPSSVQEIVDLIRLAFDLSDKYRNPAIILMDGTLGQMMEPVDISDYTPDPPPKPWATTGCKGRPPNLITSIHLAPEALEAHNLHLQEKYSRIRENEQRGERWNLEDAEVVVVAFGTVARIAKSAIKLARKNGIKAGLLRPISLWPFPEKEFKNLPCAKIVLVSELSSGQMIEDVKLALDCRLPVHFLGRMGGMVPTIEEIFDKIKELADQIQEVAK